MNDSIETIAQAIHAAQSRMGIIAHNIANERTDGYKAIKSSENFQKLYFGTASNTKNLIDVEQSNQQGALYATNNSSDISINGPGFFATTDSNGSDLSLVRVLRLNISQEGMLVDQFGSNILIDGSTFLVGDKIPNVSQDGVLSLGGQVIGRLTLVNVHDQSKTKLDANGRIVTRVSNTVEEENSKILQGYIETSNVNSSEEMLLMMQLSKQIETNQRVFRSLDLLLESGINDLGNK